MGNVLSSEDSSDSQHNSNQQVAVNKDDYDRYQAYQQERERRYVQEQQQGAHRNTISNQQNNRQNIGQNNAFQAQIPLRHQIPDHVPTQFINHPQPSSTNVNEIMNRSYNRDNSQTIMNERLHRENIQRNYDRPLVPQVQLNRSPQTDTNTSNTSNSLLSQLRNINQGSQRQAPPQSQQRRQLQSQPPQPQPPREEQTQKSIQVNKEVLEKIDPFQLTLKETLSIPQLKQKYKKLSLIHHPDRGGSVDNFNMLQKAIKNIDILIKYHTQKLTHSSLKNNFKQDIEKAPKTSNVELGKKFSVEKFNSIYEKNRIQTREDEGYGTLMESHNSDRDDITITPMGSGKITKETFNSNFNNYKQKILGDVEVHTDSLPEPSTLDRELLYKTLGDVKNNFTNVQEGYMDFKQAHIDNTLMNTNVNMKQYKSVKELEHARATNITLTEEDKRLIQLREDKRKEAEEYRKQTLEKNDTLMYERFKRANRMLLG